MEPKGSLPCSQEPASDLYPEMCPVHNLPPNFLNINYIILPSVCGSSKWSLLFRFPNWNIGCISQLYHVCYMACLSHPPRFDHLNNIWWSIKIMQLFVMPSTASCHFFLLRFTYSLQHPVLKHPQSVFFTYCDRQSFTPIHTSKIVVLCILIFKFTERRQEDILWRGQ